MWDWIIDKIPFLRSWKIILGVGLVAVLTVTYYQWRISDLKNQVLQCQVSGYIAAQDLNLKTISTLRAYNTSEIDALGQERDNLIDENADLANQLQETFKAIAAGKDAPVAPVLSDYFNGLSKSAASPNKNNSR